MANVPLVAARSFVANVSTTSYLTVPTSRLAADSNEDRRYCLFREAGTFSKLYVNISANTITADTTVTLRKNATTDGNLALTIPTSATGNFEDASDSDTSAAGDKWAYRVVVGGTGTSISFRMISVLFAATTNTVSRHCILVNSTTATTTTYFALAGAAGSLGDATEANTKADIRQSGTFKNLYVRIRTNSKAGNTPVRLRKNGANGTNIITVTSNATGDFEDTTHNDTVVAGDDINLAFETSVAGTIAPTLFSIGLETTDDKGFIYGNPMAALTQAEPLTRYYHLGGEIDVGLTVETQAQMLTRVAFTFSQLTVHITANAVAASTYRFRKNAADGNQIANITTSGTGYFSDTTNTDVCDADDLVNGALVTGTTGGTPTMTVRAVSVSVLAPAAANNVVRSLTTETVSISEAAFTRLAAKTRTRTDTAIAVAENRARLAAKVRALATQTTTLSEDVIRVKGKVKSLATETITVGGGTIARLLAKLRTASDTTAIAENRARLAAKARALTTQTTALSDSLVRIKGKLKSLATETVIVGAGTAARLLSKIRAIALQTVALTDNRTRLKGGVRTIATQTVTLSENIARTVARQVIKALATQSVNIGESIIRLKTSQRIISQTTVNGESIARLSTKLRAISLQTVALSESRTRIKGAMKAIPQTILLSENITRRLAKIRAIAAQTVILADSITRQIIGGAEEITRTLTQTVVLSDSLGRRLTVQRILSQTSPMAESLVRVRGVLRTLSQSIPVSESLLRTKSALKLISQTLLSSDSITKRMTKIRAITQTILTAENVARETLGNLVRSLVETVTVSDSIARRTAKLVMLDQFITIAEQASRISTKLRIIPAQTIMLSDSATAELNVIIKNAIKTISQTIVITEYAKIEVVKKSQRFRKILQPSIKRLISNHPAWLLGTRGMHNDYEEFSP